MSEGMEPVARRIVFVVLPRVQMLDLAGPAQVFFQTERYRIEYAGLEPEAPTAQGPALAGLTPLGEIDPGPMDTVFVPGTDETRLRRSDLVHLHRLAVPWLQRAFAEGARICSVCTGAFVLAEAGLLDGRRCTTHWACLDQLERIYPRVEAVGDRVFCKSDSVYTSAGVATGIDLALSLVEEDHGALVASQAARALVVFLRRSGADRQRSIYLDYRTHSHPGVHRAQNWIAEHIGAPGSLEELAHRVGMSSRNLSRQFKRTTGLTVGQYVDRVRIDLARHLMHNPEMTLDAISSACGYRDPRQFRRAWKAVHGSPPSASRRGNRDRRNDDTHPDSDRHVAGVRPGRFHDR